MKNTENKRSFCTDVKAEACRENPKDCCLMAELAAAVFACASLIIEGGGVHVNFSTENMAFAKRLLSVIKDTLKLDADIAVLKNTLKSRRSYAVLVKDGALLLKTIGLNEKNLFSGEPPKFITRRDCCKKAALRGAFLGCGTVSDPQKDYRLEFIAKNEAFADFLTGLLSHFLIRSKKVRRKERYVVYLNDGDGICALMSQIGAHASILNFENIRILKETRNNVNRAVNFDTANISRTVAAAVKQLESIAEIENTIGIDSLPQKLREACEIRLSHKEASLSDLCEFTGATKSAMNHRFRKIGEIAESLKGEKKP